VNGVNTVTASTIQYLWSMQYVLWPDATLALDGGKRLLCFIFCCCFDTSITLPQSKMSRAAVSAKDILPETFGDSEEETSSVENDDVENTEDVVDDLQYDVHNLLACNYHAIRVMDNEDKEEVLKSHFQRAAQLLMKRYRKHTLGVTPLHYS
jgi:hypothetical protein